MPRQGPCGGPAAAAIGPYADDWRASKYGHDAAHEHRRPVSLRHLPPRQACHPASGRDPSAAAKMTPRGRFHAVALRAINLPAGMILRCLPPEMLSADLGESRLRVPQRPKSACR